MTTEQRRLMEVLINYLENFVEHRFGEPGFDPARIEFDMADFYCTQVDSAGNLCGTSACAMGHAARLPEFNAAGLSIDPKSEDDFILNGQPIGGFDAAEQVFGISRSTAYWLFGGEYHTRTAKGEARILREFLNSQDRIAEETECRPTTTTR